MIVLATAGALVAAIDVDLLTDLVGIPLAALLVGLLILTDVVDLDPDNGVIPAFLARRRTLVLASVVTGAALLGILVARIGLFVA